MTYQIEAHFVNTETNEFRLLLFYGHNRNAAKERLNDYQQKNALMLLVATHYNGYTKGNIHP